MSLHGQQETAALEVKEPSKNSRRARLNVTSTFTVHLFSICEDDGCELRADQAAEGLTKGLHRLQLGRFTGLVGLVRCAHAELTRSCRLWVRTGTFAM